MRRPFDRGNMIGVFLGMLQSLGGSFQRFEAKSAEPKKTGRFARHAGPLRMDGYYVDRHGSLRRRQPKRDKSMSARQWRKQRRAVRQTGGVR